MSSTLLFRTCSIPIAIGTAAGLATTAHAEDHGVAFGGGVVSKSPSATAGVLVALPGSTLGDGPAVRAVVSHSEFRYVAGSGAAIKGRSQSVTLSAVQQFSGGWGYFNLAAGAARHNVRLTPNDPFNRNRGSRWVAVVGGEGVANLDKDWRLGASASYRTRIKEYYVSADLTRAVSDKVRLGVEGVGQGDPSYKRRMYGAVVSYAPTPKWQLRLSGGANIEAGKNGPYGALSISRVF